MDSHAQLSHTTQLVFLSGKVGDHAITCIAQGFEGLAAFFAREAAHLALAAMAQPRKAGS